jgi:hypothetical protein
MWRSEVTGLEGKDLPSWGGIGGALPSGSARVFLDYTTVLWCWIAKLLVTVGLCCYELPEFLDLEILAILYVRLESVM